MMLNVSEHEFRTIIRALDEARADCLMEALKGERAGNMSMAGHYYETSKYHHDLILALQAQA